MSKKDYAAPEPLKAGVGIGVDVIYVLDDQRRRPAKIVTLDESGDPPLADLAVFCHPEKDGAEPVKFVQAVPYANPPIPGAWCHPSDLGVPA